MEEPDRVVRVEVKDAAQKVREGDTKYLGLKRQSWQSCSFESLRRSHHSPQFIARKRNGKPLAKLICPRASRELVFGFNFSPIRIWDLPYRPLQFFWRRSLPSPACGREADTGYGQAWSPGFWELDLFGFNVWWSRVRRGLRAQPFVA